MAIISDEFIDSVVSIGYENKDGELEWIGTGFLVGYNNERNNSVYFVTNYHIIENKKSVLVKFNQLHVESTANYILDLYDDNDFPIFTKHPEADIIVVRIMPEVLKSGESNYNYFSINDDFFKISDMRENDIAEGSIIFGLGYPLNMVDKIKNKPICRLGCISRISDVIENNNPIEYLVDLPAFPGNSGGPVIIMPNPQLSSHDFNNNSSKIIGIIHSCISYKEECFNEVTGKIENIYEENSGLALVHPMDLVVQTIELLQSGHYGVTEK